MVAMMVGTWVLVEPNEEGQMDGTFEWRGHNSRLCKLSGQTIGLLSHVAE